MRRVVMAPPTPNFSMRPEELKPMAQAARNHPEVFTGAGLAADFADAVQAAAAAKAGDPGEYAMAKLKERLEEYDFPVLITAEWGQEKRLLKLLDDPATKQPRKVRIISQFGEIFATEAVPRLLIALKDPDIAVAKAAAIALGNIGQKESVAALIDALKTGPPELQAAAAKGLGLLGALHGDFAIIPPLLEALKSRDIAVKTEAAWALGKLPDRRAYEPLDAIARTLAHVRGPDADAAVRMVQVAHEVVALAPSRYVVREGDEDQDHPGYRV